MLQPAAGNRAAADVLPGGSSMLSAIHLSYAGSSV